MVSYLLHCGPCSHANDDSVRKCCDPLCYWKVNHNFARARRFIVLNGEKGEKNSQWGWLLQTQEGIRMGD